MLSTNNLTEIIIGCSINVHRELGPGLLESSYKECLNYELIRNELFVEKEKPLPLIYQGVKLDCGYRIDLMVEKRVIIEIKALEYLNEIHMAQVLTYLKLSDNRIGLLINFNVTKLTHGIKRCINKFYTGSTF